MCLGVILLAGPHAFAAPANDYFTNAIVLGGGSGSTNGSTVGATKETGEPSIGGNAGGASVWFRWVAPANGTMVFSTAGSSFDTMLAVYTGTNVSTLTLVGANDDIEYPTLLTSAVTFAATTGTEYRITVDGYSGGSGNYLLGWVYPVVQETVNSTLVTNYTAFVYDSDVLYGGTTNRDRLRIASSVVSSNLSSLMHNTTYVLSYRLMDTNNLPHPILDSSGVTNAAYTYNITNTMLIGGLSNVVYTNFAGLKPATPLNPYDAYYVELKINRLGAFTGAMGRGLTNVYLEFTNLTSPDLALNTIPYQFGPASWVQTYAIQTAPGQTAFAASTFLGLYRYDNFSLAAPTTDNVTVYLNYELHNASNGALIPLKNSVTNFTHAVASFTPGTAAPPTPNSMAYTLATDTFLLEPVSQIDSVDFNYYVVVNLSLDNGLGPPYVQGNSIQGPATELLHFNGNVNFGGIGTTLSSLGVAPPANAPSGGLIPTTLSSAGGYVSAKPDHTYAGAGPFSVNLDSLGNAYVTAGSVILNAPTPDNDSIARVRFQRGPVLLSTAGASANVTTTLPAGFGYRTGDISNPVIQGKLAFTSVALTPTLAPAAAVMTYAPGTTVYAAEESKPAWFAADHISWTVNAGAFDFPSTTAIYVRANAFAYLQSVSNNLVDPPNMGDKRSNDRYWESLTGLASNPLIRTDSGSNALLSTTFNFTSGSFRTHFPYDSLVQWTGLGAMKVVNDLVPANSGSLLNGASLISVSYSQGCPDCGPSGTALATPVLAITNGLFTFTLDGGLVAVGTSPGIDLRWGYIPSIPAFAQQALHFTDGAFHMPGVFLRGDQNTLPAVQRPTTILYTGFEASNLGAVERPLSAGYSAGFADYAGLNFRCVADGVHTAISTIAGTPGITWLLDAPSKYYARYAGISGIHEAVPGSFPSALTLWGYQFTFTSYGLSYLDSQNKDSVTDGAVSLPYPAQFVQGFNNMNFSCLGSPTGGDVPPGEPFKVMAYWLADFKTHSIQFKTADSCAPNDGGYLVLGIEAYASHIPKPLYGQVGFFSSGDQIPPAFGLADVTSRLKAPSVVKIDGPNKTTYSFTPVQDAYYNVWSNSPALPTSGWMSFYGDLSVPFFKVLQLHWQTSCHTNGVASTNAPIYLSGGWPRPGSGNPNYGWLDGSGRTPFETNMFDYASQGWPKASVDIATYREDPNDQKWHPRAQRLWLGIVDFDYPLSWNTTLRSFKSWQEVTNNLLVVSIQHQIKYMDAKHAEIDFGAQYDGLPTISIANLAFNAIDEATGVGDAIAKAAAQPIEDVLSAGLDEMDQMLNAQMKQLMDGVFDKTVNPVIDQFYAQLSNDWASAWSSLPVSQRQQFLLSVSTNTLYYFVGGGGAQAATTLTKALGGLANGVNQANNLIGRVEGYLQDATNAIESVIGVLSLTTNGAPLGSNIVGLVSQQGGSRPVVPKLIQSLVGDLAPQFIDAVIGPTVSNLLSDVEPELAEITSTLQQTESALSLVSSNLGTAGQFTLEMSNILASASGELSNVSYTVSLAVTQYFGQLDYNIDNPFTHISPADVKSFIRQHVEDQFFASAAASQIQTSLRQRLYDVDAAMKTQVDSVFQQLNGMMRDLISQSLAELDDTISKTLGSVSDVIGAGKLNGHALIDGDSLKELRIDGHFQFKVPDDMELDAFLLIKELNSDGSSGCTSGNAPATEVTIGANNIPLGWLSSDLKADLEAKFTFDGTHPFPVNLGGQISLNGDLDFETFVLHDLAAALAFGEFENYLALKGGVRFNGFDFSGAIFFGRTCSLDPLILIDPEVAKVVGSPPFTGAYCYAQGWLPISQLVLGIPASCLFEISAGIGAGAFYFAEGPTYGGKMFLGVSGSLLCIVSIEGDVTMIGVKHGADMNFDGHGHFEASLGPCPFCISISKDVDVTYLNNSWSIH